MNKLTLQQAQELNKVTAEEIAGYPSLRTGQALYNNFIEWYPEWYVPIWGDKPQVIQNDPFYNDELIPGFLEEILDPVALEWWNQNPL